MSPIMYEDSEGPLKIGQIFLSKYEILALIGRGGHAFVYEARHRFMGHQVAIKILHHDRGVSQEMLRRGQAEAQLQKGLRHPNIVEIDDAGLTDNGQLYIVMERLRGRLWRDALLEYGRFEVEEVLHLAAQVADGLHAAHERGVVHRDVKPDNAFLTKYNGLKVLDFGVAKFADVAAWATQKDMVLGTIYYMSPEQVLAGAITAKSDIYALGVMMYEALLGEHPVARALGSSVPNMYNFTRIIVREVMQPLDELNPRIPRYIADLINTATEKKPEWRFASMAEFATEIRECLSNYRDEAKRRGIPLQTRDLSRASKANSGVDLKDPAAGPREATPAPPSPGHDTEPVSRPLFFGAVASDILALQRQSGSLKPPAPAAAPGTPAAPRASSPPAAVSSARPTIWSQPVPAPAVAGTGPSAEARSPLPSVASRTLTDVAMPAVTPRSVPVQRIAPTPPPAARPAAQPSQTPASRFAAQWVQPMAQRAPQSVQHAGARRPKFSPTLLRAVVAGATVGFITFGVGALYLAPSGMAPQGVASKAGPRATDSAAPTVLAHPAPPVVARLPATAGALPPSTAASVAQPAISSAPRQISSIPAPPPAASRSSVGVASGLPFDETSEGSVKPAKPATKAKAVDKMDERMRRLEQNLDKNKSFPWTTE